MKSIKELTQKYPWLNWVLFLGTAGVVFLIGMLASNIMQRRNEAQLYFQQVKPIAEWESNNKVWGENFPREYETFLQTKDTSFKSDFGGSQTIDYLSKYPDLVVLWAGYAFSKEYKQSRGHYYALEDIISTMRTVQPQPATCWTCKSPDVPVMMNKMGIEAFYKGKWIDMGKNINNAIGCQDCHDPKTMNLRISRPALIEAFKRQGKDIEKATHQEMRSLVCAQCHVEYYFKGEGKYLTFPWDKGMIADSIEKYYDVEKFKDFEHSLSKTPVLKAQHPDYEIYTTGIHAQRNVACADCHMPYKREGAIKFTDHKIQSPLNNISASCAVCHREPENKLKNNVYDIQHKVETILIMAEKNLAEAHIMSKMAWEAGAKDDDMKDVLELIRHSQWRWDYVAASNGMGFHSPVEAMRVLATSIQKSQQASRILTQVLIKYNVKLPIVMPDISTKDKAQLYIKLDMAKIGKEKANFKATILPMWQKNYPKK